MELSELEAFLSFGAIGLLFLSNKTVEKIKLEEESTEF